MLADKGGHLFRAGGAAALTDAGLAAAPAVQRHIQRPWQGAHLAAGQGQAVAGAVIGGGQGGAQTIGGLGQPDGHPVQAVRGQPRLGVVGGLPGDGGCGQRIKKQAAQPMVGLLQRGMPLGQPVDCQRSLAVFGKEKRA